MNSPQFNQFPIVSQDVARILKYNPGNDLWEVHLIKWQLPENDCTDVATCKREPEAEGSYQDMIVWMAQRAPHELNP